MLAHRWHRCCGCQERGERRSIPVAQGFQSIADMGNIPSRQHPLRRAAVAATDNVASAAPARPKSTLQQQHGAEPQPIACESATAVFRIHCIKDKPRHDMPLLLGSISSLWRTAFACTHGGRSYLLTAASAVCYSTQIDIYKPGVEEPFKASVQHMSLDLELAVLQILDSSPKRASTGGSSNKAGSRTTSKKSTARARRAATVGIELEDLVEEEEEDKDGGEHQRFWSGVQALALGELPRLQQCVQVLLPEATDLQPTSNASVTTTTITVPAGNRPQGTSLQHASSSGRAGIVSSNEAQSYPSSLQSLLASVVIAKVRSRSNLGAPVVAGDGTVAGLVIRRITPRRSTSAPHAGNGGSVPGTPGARIAQHTRRRRLAAGQQLGTREAERIVTAPPELIRRFLDTAEDHRGSGHGDVSSSSSSSGGSSSSSGVTPADDSVAVAPSAAPLEVPPLGVSELPGLGVMVKSLNARALAQSLGMSNNQQGVLVLAVNPCSSAAAVLKAGDVLMQVGDAAVQRDGKITLSGCGAQIPFTAYVAQQLPGSFMGLTVLRQGRELQLSLRLAAAPKLLPTHLGGRRPPYIVVGGLLLARCCVPYLSDAFGSQWPKLAPIKLLDKLKHFPTDPDEEVVVVAACQPLRCMDGYPAGMVEHRILRSVNGQRVLNMHHAAQLVFGCQAEFLRLDLEGEMVVVLSTAQAQADTKLMLLQYEVKLPVSDDLVHLLPKPKRRQSLRLGSSRRAL